MLCGPPLLSGVPAVAFTTGTLLKSPRGSVNDTLTQPCPIGVETRYQLLLLLVPSTGSSLPPAMVATVLNCGPSPDRTLRNAVLTTRIGLAPCASAACPNEMMNKEIS